MSALTITGHARLAGNTSGNEDNLSASKALLQTSGSVWAISLDCALGVDVANVGSDTFIERLAAF